MKKLLITILLLGLTGCSTPVDLGKKEIPENLKLKVSKDRILNHIIIKAPTQLLGGSGTSTEQIISTPAVDIVQYDYISTTEIPAASITVNKKNIQEDLNKRTENSQHFKIKETATSTEYQAKFFSGEPFYKDADKWFQTETATTTLGAWDEQAKITLLEKIKQYFGRSTLATDYYSGAGDGVVNYKNATWSTARGAATGDSAAYGSSANSQTEMAKWSTYWSAYYIVRCFYPIVTSGLGSGVIISSATFNKFYTWYQYDGGGADLIQTSQASNSSLTTADFDAVAFTAGATRVTPSSTAAYTTWTLNATGLSWISKTGTTNLGIIGSYDFDNTQPPNIQDSTGYFSQYTGTDHDPYLAITYTVASTIIPDNDIIIFE